MNVKNVNKGPLAVVLIVFFACIFACSSPPSADSSEPLKYGVTNVNEYPFLFNETQKGGMIAFSSAELKKCTLSFVKKNLVPGYSASINQLGEGDFDISCLSENDYFTMSPIERTHASLSVKSNGSALSVLLSFTLYSSRTKTFLSESAAELTLSTKQAASFK